MVPAARGTTHPHASRPTRKAVRDCLAGRGPALRDLYLATHDLIREADPDIEFEIDLADGTMRYGQHQYGYGGWGALALACHSKWISLGFFRGTHLPDPMGILEGTGKNLRHVKIRSAEDLAARGGAISALIRAALAANT